MVDALEQVNDVTITFVDEDGEKSNNNINITEKSRECPICHVYYKYGNSYWQHVRYVHASYLSQCVICEKCYKRSTMAKHHILHSHKIAWHLCGNYVRKIRKSDLQQKKEISNVNDKQNSSLKFIKKKTLHLIQSFNCYDCNGSFSTIKDLFDHVKNHKQDFDEIKSSDDNETIDTDAEKTTVS